MAYQKVGTPRFYIDLPSYITSMGGEMGESVRDPEIQDKTKTKVEMPNGAEI